MSIAKLEFTLPEEQNEFRAATEGQAARSALWAVDEHCRRTIRYSEELTEPAARVLQEIRDLIRNSPGLTIE